jgi:hypothetical protein
MVEYLHFSLAPDRWAWADLKPIAPFDGVQFPRIVLRDMTVPVRQRHNEHCGPYYWTPKPFQRGQHTGRGFYMGANGEMDRAGSSIRLRLETVLDRFGRERAWAHEYSDTPFCAIIARLPRGRGFLAGWSLGDGMCASLDGAVYREEYQAAHAACNEAEAACERDLEDQERFFAEEAAREAEEAEANARPFGEYSGY